MKEKPTLNKSRTNFKRLTAMEDGDIDFSDIPEISPSKFAQAVVRYGLRVVPNKKQLTLRVDSDVLKWFKAQGRGYQTRINALLRAYMKAQLARIARG